MAADKDKMKWRQEGAKNPLYGHPALYDAALNAFSAMSYGKASLNDIIKAAGLNKGSFYYRFFDKMDLYLSLLHRIGMEKMDMLQPDNNYSALSSDFFESFREKALHGLRFAQRDSRYNALWRRFLSEESIVQNEVHRCFGDITQNTLAAMIEEGKTARQLRFDVTTQMAALLFSALLEQIDLLIEPTMDDKAILAQVDKLVSIMKSGMQASADTLQR
jgi:AcrR family transcriptional regulator